VGWIDRWAARSQRFADRRDEHYRQHQEAVRAGTAPPTWIDRSSAHSQQVADTIDANFRQVRDVVEILSAGPVSGPDNIPVRICLSEGSVQFLLSSRPPKLSMPKPWLHAITTERTLTSKAAAVTMSACIPTWVHAYAVSGPQRQVRYRFRFSMQAIRYVLELARDVRKHGVVALDFPPPPDWLAMRPPPPQF
jgi:hypothetical protein